jgi:hypothetical protein
MENNKELINQYINDFYMLQLVLQSSDYGEIGTNRNKYHNQMLEELITILINNGFTIKEEKAVTKKSVNNNMLDFLNDCNLIPSIKFWLFQEDNKVLPCKAIERIATTFVQLAKTYQLPI